jgi:hypothetical protein
LPVLPEEREMQKSVYSVCTLQEEGVEFKYEIRKGLFSMIAPAIAKAKSGSRRFNFYERRAPGREYRDWLFYSDIELRSAMYHAGMLVCKPRPLIDWEALEFEDITAGIL